MKHDGLLGAGALNPAPGSNSRVCRPAGKVDEFSAFTAAYQESQPKPVYAEEEPEEGEGE